MITNEERRRRWERIHDAREVNDGPQSHLEGFTTKGRKRKIDDLALDLLNVKAQRMEYVSSQATGNTSLAVGGVSVHKSSKGEAPPPPSTLWSDVGFDNFRFMDSHLPFFEEFPNDYEAL